MLMMCFFMLPICLYGKWNTICRGFLLNCVGFRDEAETMHLPPPFTLALCYVRWKEKKDFSYLSCSERTLQDLYLKTLRSFP